MAHLPQLTLITTRPYFVRAIYEWALDHRMTPQVMVDAGAVGVVVPANYAKQGRIVLSIHPQAVQALQINNEHLRFSARFSGAPFAVYIPIAAVVAIYCKENDQGMVFRDDDDSDANTPKPAVSVAPHLKLVK